MTGDPPTGEEALRRLAQRLMSSSHHEGPLTAELFAGTLPDSLSLDLPPPAATILLGSRRRSLTAAFGGDERTLTLRVDRPHPADAE